MEHKVAMKISLGSLRCLSWLTLLVMLVAASAAAWLSAYVSEKLAVAELRAVVRNKIDFYNSSLRNALDRYSGVPLTLARHPDISALLDDANNDRLMKNVSRDFKVLANAAGVVSIFLMDSHGLTIASSNFEDPVSSVGESLPFRPYLIDALRTGVGRYFAIGTTTKVPGYFIAYPVGDKKGVVVIKVGVSALEQAWPPSAERVIVTDRHGIVFLTNVPAWRFKSLRQLDAPVAAQIKASLQYGDSEIEPLPFQVSKSNVLTLGNQHLLIEGAQLPGSDWSLHVMTDLELINYRILNAALLAGFGFLAILLTLFLLIQRRQVARDYKENLERQVRERTAELVQAGQMAALGQMAAGIAHEIVQPVTAIRGFADNSRAYLESNQLSRVMGNLGEITALTERLVDFIRRIKNFSPNLSVELGTVDLIATLEEALALVVAVSRRPDRGMEVRRDFPEGSVWVVAEGVRLQQVLVNLFNNAMDAMKDSPHCVLDLKLRLQKETVSLWVRDSGAGLAESHLTQVFKPFFTTKPEGWGLGLSISHTIMREFEGRLTAENYPDGGAVFTLILKQAEAKQ